MTFKKINNRISLLFLVVIFYACNPTITIPERNSWTNYQPQYLKQYKEEQWAYTKHYSIYWEAKEKETFTSQYFIKRLTNSSYLAFGDSIFIAKKDLPQPRTVRKATDIDYDLRTEKNYPQGYQRWINEDIWIFRFIERKRDTTYKNMTIERYIIINIDGTKLTLLEAF